MQHLCADGLLYKHFVKVLRPLHQSIMKRLVPRSVRILDMCCGVGQLSRTICENLKSTNVKITAVDVSSSMVAEATYIQANHMKDDPGSCYSKIEYICADGVEV